MLSFAWSPAAFAAAGSFAARPAGTRASCAAGARMAATPPPPPPPPQQPPRGVGSEGGAGGVRGHIPYARLGEFAYAGGDPVTQDTIVENVRWQVAQVASEDMFDENIRQFGSGMSDLLSGMFLRRQKDIIARNEALALRAALGDMARWNSTYREGQKACQKRREQISEELAVINKLLLSQQRNRKKRMGSRTSDRRRATTAPGIGPAFAAAHAAIVPVDVFGSVPRPFVLPIIGSVTAACLCAFEHAVQESSPRVLAQVSITSLIAVVALVHLRMLGKLSDPRR